MINTYACLLLAATLGAEYEPNTPFTYLFDTGAAASAALEPAALAAKAGWSVVEEDELKHAFRGDTVLLNDKLVVVLRRQAAGAEIYARAAGGFQHRATVGPPPAATGLKSIRALENGPSAVLVQAVFTTADGREAALSYRLTTGQGLLELRAAAGVNQVAVVSAADWAVVPDFFGDDVVLGAESSNQSRLGVPAENFFLTLADQGRAMLMCVWPSAAQRAELTFSTEPQRAIRGFTVDVPPKPEQPMWLALLEGAGLWQDHSLAAGPASELVWKPPFAAKWRGAFPGRNALAVSWNLPAVTAGEEEPESAVERCPCRLAGDRLQITWKTEPPPRPEHLLIYPIDRSRATPLTVFCPIDILRNTLGVGPCQYILQTEGLASDANPTPDNVMKWVEQQFHKKKQKRAADEIRGLLDQMVEHLGHIQQRVARYHQAVAGLRTAIPSGAAGAGMRQTVTYLDRALADAMGQTPREKAAALSAQVVALTARSDSEPDCRRLGQEIRRLGAVQDAALARARMGLRWLREQARQAQADQVFERVNQALQGR
jgi:hypothetical protein